ncbi:MAG: hypothetical protein QM479_07880, partial [Pseudomonadota bacterium]
MKMQLKLLFIFFINSSAFAASYPCTLFDEVKNSTGVLFTLDVCISSAYNGRVKWKFTNHTQSTVYNVSIANKIYTLSDSKVVNRSGETIKSKVLSGESTFTITDAVNTDENYGNWSDKNDNPVVSVSLGNPSIKFRNTIDGPIVSWDLSSGGSSSENSSSGNPSSESTSSNNPSSPTIDTGPDYGSDYAGGKCGVHGEVYDCNNICRTQAYMESSINNNVCDANLNCSWNYSSYKPWSKPDSSDCANSTTPTSSTPGPDYTPSYTPSTTAGYAVTYAEPTPAP